MNINDGWALIAKAFEKKQKDRAFQLYAAIYPNFTKDNFVTFEKFYKGDKKLSSKTKEEILVEVQEIRKKFKG